ncbi:aurora kinase A and ninein-interacting protein [Centropristis striata]|uniref:aurora kinase A and ninein-interacting protein n=1 Tax=Centropristis striata TaxID=184440 RepID=UPI0027E05A57|nr:aurora kinase A and ninein-interacting protein [Centropristis striata]
MKTSKPLQSFAQEECGVWLDTVQLKGKAQKKRLARPISKLLNPFVEGRGYSLAVALNFTQTKLEMPKTKQSSISTFFAGQRRVLNKMSTSEVPNMDPVQPSSPSTPSTPEASGKKRRREIDLEISDFCNSDPGVDHESRRENVNEPEAAMWQERAASHTPSQNVYCESEEEPFEEINPPQRKRRLTAASQLPCDSQPVPQAWSQDPLLTCSQYSESELDQTNMKKSTAKNFIDSEPNFLNSLQSEDAFGIRINMDGRTSTQKSLRNFHSSQTDDEKENSMFWSPKSPRKHSTLSQVQPLSNLKWTESKSVSPRKRVPEQLWKKADKEESLDSQFKWIKPNSSPVKKPAAQLSGREADEDSLATLFTQDSEGFRVIAHRGLQARSPLKDQSNISSGRVKMSACKSLVEEDEEDDMLFTQDSQGNMVIKH